MYPSPYDSDDDLPESQQVDLERLGEWRVDDRQFLGWRWDSATDVDYYDGNQFSAEDRSEMARAGVPMITNNRIARQINDVIGMQASQLTDWILRSETIGNDDMVQALGQSLKTAERMTKANRSCLQAFGDQIKAGIGWVEVCRERSPMRYPYVVRSVPWREMWWDWRANANADLHEAAYIRRGKWYRKDVVQSAFPDMAGEIEYERSNDDQSRQLIEPQQYYRSYNTYAWRDPPLTWNLTSNMHENMRFVEEVWYQVQIEGDVVRLANGKVMAYDRCQCNPMVQLALKTGLAEIETGASYSRWRQAFWVGDCKLQDRWSPLPFDGPPYIPFWGYREAMTGVPYGLIRILRSLQDTVNTLEGKILFSMSAVRVKVRQGATDINELRRTIGDKRAVIEMDPQSEMEDVQIDEHLALNEQHMRVLDGTMNSMDAVTGTAGLNPASMSEGKPRSAAQVQAMTLRAMATLGEIQDNYQDSRTVVGEKLLDLVREDIVKRGGQPVQVKKSDGRKVLVNLHQKVTEHLGHDVIDNDVTMLHAQVVLDDVPHTATYRAQQFEKIADVLQTMPPEAVDVRRIMLPKLVECSDLPDAEGVAQQLREATGLAPPTDPKAIAAAQAQQQMQEQQHELQVQMAMSQISKNQAHAQDLAASAAKKQAEAQAMAQEQLPSPEEADAALLEREKKVTHIAQIRAKTAKTLADTANATQPQHGIVSRW